MRINELHNEDSSVQILSFSSHSYVICIFSPFEYQNNLINIKNKSILNKDYLCKDKDFHVSNKKSVLFNLSKISSLCCQVLSGDPSFLLGG